MNPFDLNGTQFLALYSGLLLASGVIVYLFWRTLGQSGNYRRPMTDPYLIAYLRGGAKEAVKVAAATLTHRRAAKVRGETITSETGQTALAINQLEKTILENCLAGATLQQLSDGKPADVAEELFHHRLISEHLILSDDEKRKALLVKILVIGALVAVAGIKIFFAFQSGRYNETFLLMLAGTGATAHSRIILWYTPAGSTALKDLKTLFGRLRSQTKQLVNPSQNHHFSFLIAVFGVAAVSTREYFFISAFKTKKGSNSGCGMFCGISCNSGGCCGGGCGGGCGGCGS
jgi:uncharacterized protein (TIGR04222 family)